MNIPAKVKNVPKIKFDHFLKKLFMILVLFTDIKVAIVNIVITDIIPNE